LREADETDYMRAFSVDGASRGVV